VEYFVFVGDLNLSAFKPNVKFSVGDGSVSDVARWSGERFSWTGSKKNKKKPTKTKLKVI